MISRKLVLAAAACGLITMGVAACGGGSSSSSTTGGSGGASLSGEINGAGSTAQEAAEDAWIATFTNDNSNVKMSYDPVGSGGGQEQFLGGGVDYAGSDAPFDSEQLTKAQKRCSPGELVEIPNYISPLVFIYNLPDVDSLQLSPDTAAAIFKGDITSWDDPAIKEDNPDASLPSTDIVPVHRSDDSGTTFNFTDYLHQAAPKTWTFPASETFPVKSGESGDGTSGVVQAVTQGEGTIGYADESQAGDLGIAKVKVGNQYVEPSPEGAAKDLEISQIDKPLSPTDNTLVFSVERTSTDPSTYPLLLTSYLYGCTKYDSSSTAAIVQSYFNFVISPDGQQVAAKNAGSAPMTDALRQKIQPAVDAIGG